MPPVSRAITGMLGQTKPQKVVSVPFFLKYISACKKTKLAH